MRKRLKLHKTLCPGCDGNCGHREFLILPPMTIIPEFEEKLKQQFTAATEGKNDWKIPVILEDK